MMFSRRLVLNSIAALVLCSACLFSAPATAEKTVQATAHVERVASRAIDLMQIDGMSTAERYGQLEALMRDGLHIPLIARTVLGRAWRKTKDDERAQFVELFDAYLIRSIYRGLESYNGQTLVITKTTPKGERDVLVHSRIERAAQPPVTALWRVRDMKGTPKIIDVVVEGISLVITKRDEFSAVVRNQGVSGLIRVLEVKTRPSMASAD